jgi:hypothetical protein
MFESSAVIRDDDDDDDDDKGKSLPRTGHERPKEEHKYSSTLSLTSAPGGVVVNATPRPQSACLE